MSEHDLERYAEILRESGFYRVLRRLEPRRQFSPVTDEPLKIGLILDVEATGVEESDTVIELAIVKFSFSGDGVVHEVLDVFDRMRDPSPAEISDEITQLTNITQEMVAGQVIASEEVEKFVAGAVIVIAHNAKYDRGKVEKLFPVFKHMCWACSHSEINWSKEGFSSTRLGDLLATLGYFHGGHRADADCFALLEILASPLPKAGRPALGLLLERSRLPSTVTIVEGVRNAREYFVARGYRWHYDETYHGWRLESSDFVAKIEAEIIDEDWPNARVIQRRVSAWNRHSDRI